MITLRVLCVSLLVLPITGQAAPVAEPDPAVLSYKLPSDLKWSDSPTNPGLKSAVLYGDPSKRRACWAWRPCGSP